MSIFGQVWLWSLLAFVFGAVLTWLFLVLPARKRIRELESRLAVAHAETPRAAARPAPQAPERAEPATTYLERHTIGGAEADSYGEPTTIEPAMDHELPLEIAKEPDSFEEQFAEFDQLLAQPHLEPEPEPEPEPTPEPEPEPEQAPPTEYFGAVLEPEPSVSQTLEPLAGESLFGSDGRGEHEPWFDLDDAPERSPFEDAPVRSPFEEPAAHAYFDDSPVTEYFPAAPRHAEPPAEPLPEVHEAPQFGAIESLTEAEQAEQAEQADSAYAFGSADLPEAGAETELEMTQILPKRQRRESPRGGFDPPRPIQPSMRAVERREPSPELTGGHSGSLFEPAVPPNQQLPLTSSAPEPAPARHQVSDSVPAGPFGPGSAMPRPGGGRPSDDFGVKASVTALRYCTDESPQFPRMVAEVWFRTPEDAERVGFRPLT